MLLSGLGRVRAANILLPASEAETRAEEDGIASALPSNHGKKKGNSPPSGGTQKAKKAKTKSQRAASVQQLTFVAREDSPAAAEEPQQPVAEAQDVDEHGRCLLIRSEREQEAAEQEAGQQAAPVMQQQDTVAQDIFQPDQPVRRHWWQS